MTKPKYDVLGIGNAIVDVLAHIDDAMIADNGLTKGTMRLIDTAEAERIYGLMGPAVQVSGGSASNTVAGIARLGGRAAIFGKVADDELGRFFRHDIVAEGVHYDTTPLEDADPSGRCMVMISPDAQRTMNTYLGASTRLSPKDIDAKVVADAAVTYLEGYLWDPPEAKEAFLTAAGHAHAAGRKVALSASDPFCVERHRGSFLALVRDHIDILFANEAEISALYESDVDSAMEKAIEHLEVLVVTRSEKGSSVWTADERVDVAAAPVAEVVDTTGAGDLFAAGFLAAFTRGASLEHSAKLGSLAAAEVIAHIGARPEHDLEALAAEAGLSIPEAARD